MKIFFEAPSIPVRIVHRVLPAEEIRADDADPFPQSGRDFHLSRERAESHRLRTVTT